MYYKIDMIPLSGPHVAPGPGVSGGGGLLVLSACAVVGCAECPSAFFSSASIRSRARTTFDCR